MTISKQEKFELFYAINTTPEIFTDLYKGILVREAMKHLTDEEKENQDILTWLYTEADEIATSETRFYTQTDDGKREAKTEEDFCNGLTPKRDGRTIAKWAREEADYFSKLPPPPEYSIL